MLAKHTLRISKDEIYEDREGWRKHFKRTSFSSKLEIYKGKNYSSIIQNNTQVFCANIFIHHLHGLT